MKWSLHPVILGGSLCFEEQLALARDAGYDGLDVDISYLHGVAAERGLTCVQDLFASYGVVPAGTGLPMDWRVPEDAFSAAMGDLSAMAETMAALGCPRTFTWMPPSVGGAPDDFRHFVVTRFRQIGRVLGDHGVRFGLEWIGPPSCRTSGTPFIHKMAHALQVIDDIGLDNLGLLIDSWHWFTAQDTLEELRALRPEQIVHVHFVDAPDRPLAEQIDMEREIPGRGIIPLVDFYRALRDAGYRDFLAVEIFGAGLRDMPPREAAAVVKASCDEIATRAGGPSAQS
ncbi:MAG: sugar phosphate isomerase/epimerase [Armatimonadetes bacterium]|nr:sugar phosphate isomerase/epimerase [Armatimonadota bacterium]